MGAPLRNPPRYDELAELDAGVSEGHLPINEEEEIIQVVYESDQNGAVLGVESSQLRQGTTVENHGQSTHHSLAPLGSRLEPANESDSLAADNNNTEANQHLSRAASTLPSVAEESTTSSGAGGACLSQTQSLQQDTDNREEKSIPEQIEEQLNDHTNNQQQTYPIYSTVIKEQQHPNLVQSHHVNQSLYQSDAPATSFHSNIYENEQQQQQQLIASENFSQQSETNAGQIFDQQLVDCDDYPNINESASKQDDQINEAEQINEQITELIARQRGAVEKGSFRNNFRKKLGVSVSTNETDLTTYRQRLIEDSSSKVNRQSAPGTCNDTNGDLENNPYTGDKANEIENYESDGLPSKFKRTHSVSFNIHSSRSNRLSVDIRNLPSYLTHKRTSIVDVAKGAMSSLINSLGGGTGSGAGSVVSDRRDSNVTMAHLEEDEEPIFEEPIAPTLSLGQRVALVRSGVSEFGTVGWIGQLPEVDDDWIVGVIFDNMIGNCDGSLNGMRYFYARENYAMFVPLSSLTKTDNYIGRPETGTMLSRMSIALKPGQLISIQRSSIRLQHCFLNAPHQRVGHDVRAVSNRLHCQCHNCGPCAHLTKQGRVAVLPHFGSHHLPHRKKNSLAHAAVELLAHHHHHFHEEEEDHEEKDYQFGDNAAHACNFVRYSCCQQNGVNGHSFSNDCEMVRPELLDNLIHAPKAPHRRSRPRRARRDRPRRQPPDVPMIGPPAPEEQERWMAPPEEMVENKPDGQKMLGPYDPSGGGTMGSVAKSSERTAITSETGSRRSSVSSCNSSSFHTSQSSSSIGSNSSSSRPSSKDELCEPQQPAYNYYTYDSTTTCAPASVGYGTAGAVYNTIDSHISIMDQRRFISQRDSSTFVRQNNDDYCDGSEMTQDSNPGIGKRILRYLGCLKRGRRGSGRRSKGRRHRRSSNRSSMSSSSRRKLSARDKVLEFRRRQSQFVPSTLAKPEEDFSSHGIILNKSMARGLQMIDANSDYSSYSKSSSCSSSPCSRKADPQIFTADVHALPNPSQNDQQQTMEHVQTEPGSNADYQLKSNLLRSNPEQPEGRVINYGDYTFGEGYESYAKDGFSRDSALTDLAYSSETFKTNSSCDTLKQLVDQSINEQVPQLSSVVEVFGSLISPLSSEHDGEDSQQIHSSTSRNHQSEVDISSPTASTASAFASNDVEEQDIEISRDLERLDLAGK